MAYLLDVGHNPRLTLAGPRRQRDDGLAALAHRRSAQEIHLQVIKGKISTVGLGLRVAQNKKPAEDLLQGCPSPLQNKGNRQPGVKASRLKTMTVENKTAAASGCRS